MDRKQASVAECLLFVAGEPVLITELARAMELETAAVRQLLYEMETAYRDEQRGILLLVTDETAQMISNRAYIDAVERLIQPEQKRSVSQSMLETLAIVAYRQPVTRAEIESVRGVRCEYAITQLQKLDLIQAVGRKDVIGKPMLYGTTDTFLRKFGMHNLSELPPLDLESAKTDAETEMETV
ncbi:MAG: SMC-Scp complex subunit ScpB [Clostridia bacterium]|nr:SMC-Scp complex subunit ScpB [Clostridia bacterium]